MHVPMYRWGILVCNDGVFPYYTGDWSELDALKKQGADSIVWSVGGMVPIAHLSSSIAKKYQWNVIASEDVTIATGDESAALVGADGATFPSQHDVSFESPTNYTKQNLKVRLATLP